MKEAVIVSTARTGLAKSMRGGFNMTHGAVMGGHAVKHAIARAGSIRRRWKTSSWAAPMPEGATGMNIARLSAIWAGCPVTTAGVTVNRFCSSGLQAIAMAAQQIMTEGTRRRGRRRRRIHLAGADGRHEPQQLHRRTSDGGQAGAVDVDDRDRRDRGRALRHLARSARTAMRWKASSAPPPRKQAGRFNDEIVPLTTKMKKFDKASGAGIRGRCHGRPRRMQPPRHDL